MKDFLISVELTGSLETEDTNVGPLTASHVHNSIVLLLVRVIKCTKLNCPRGQCGKTLLLLFIDLTQQCVWASGGV